MKRVAVTDGRGICSSELTGTSPPTLRLKAMSSLSGAQFPASSRPEIVGRCVRPDVALLERAQRGDRAAYGQVVVLYQDRLYNAVLRLVGDREEARELTQEAFMRGLSSIESFRGNSSPYTWLFRIAMNLAIGHLRKVSRHRVFSLDANQRDGSDQAAGLKDRVARERGGETPLQKMERRERDEKVLAALGRVHADYRAVLVMRDIEGFDYATIAEMLDLPQGTLKSRLFRARLALRDELKSYLR